MSVKPGQAQIDQLESGIDGCLIIRTNSRYRGMQLTPRGQQLLDHLAEPLVQQILDRYAPVELR